MMRTNNQTRKPSIESVQRQFAQWRRHRKRGEKIPEDLWAVAAGLTREHSIHKVSRALGLNHTELKERSASQLRQSPGEHKCSPEFVELDVTGLPGVVPEYTVEFEDALGQKIRVSMQGVGGGEVIYLVRELRSLQG